MQLFFPYPNFNGLRIRILLRTAFAPAAFTDPMDYGTISSWKMALGGDLAFMKPPKLNHSSRRSWGAG